MATSTNHANSQDFAAMGLSQSVWDTRRAAPAPTAEDISIEKERERSRTRSRQKKSEDTARAQRLRAKERAIAAATRVNPESGLGYSDYTPGVHFATGAMRTC